MDAAMGTCDCQMCADDGRRRGSLCCQHSSASVEGRRGYPKTQALTGSRVHPLAPGDRESAALLWPRQRHRDSNAFVPYFGKWAPEASSASESPSVSSPQPIPWGSEWPEPASSQKWGSRGGTGVGQTPRVEVLGEWGFSELGTVLKGRSVTRWSRGRHQSNKCCLHKVATWVIASLSSLRTKSCGSQEGNSPVGSLSVSLLSRNSWEGEGIPRICPSVQGQ